MKRVLVALLALIVASGFAFAQDESASQALTPMVDKGELLATAGIGWGGITGGAEFTFYRIDIADILPITFGAAARVLVDPGLFYSGWSTFALGAGGFGTAHVGFKDLELPSELYWVTNFDAYAGVGLGFGMATSIYDYYTPRPGIGISTFEGASYYLNDALAITFEYGYIGNVRYDWDDYGYTYSYSYPLWYSNVGLIIKL
ncbi:MAG: hypothetical protein JXM71_04360 [Spirochaetales bacterium]|nr:hypothetical protein [Spirochaetales bacterium]